MLYYIILNRGIDLILIGITIKSGKHLRATYGTLNSCFDLIGSHQQCIPWSPPLEIEPTITECRGRNSTPGPSAQATHKRCHVGNAWPLNLMSWRYVFLKYGVTLQTTRSPLRPRLPKSALCNPINLTSWARKRLYNFK